MSKIVVNTPNTLPLPGAVFDGHTVANRVFDLSMAYATALATDEALALHEAIVRCAVLAARARKESPKTNLADLIGERSLALMRELQALDPAQLAEVKIAEREAQTNTGVSHNGQKVNLSKSTGRIQWKVERGLPLTPREERIYNSRLRHRLNRLVADNDNGQNDYAFAGAHIAEAILEADALKDNG